MKTSEVLIGSALLGAAGAAYYFLVYRPFKANAAKAVATINEAGDYINAGGLPFGLTDEKLNSMFWINIQNNSQPGGIKQLVVPKGISPWFANRETFDTGLVLTISNASEADKKLQLNYVKLDQDQQAALSQLTKVIKNNVWNDQVGMSFDGGRTINFVFGNGRSETWLGFLKLTVFPTKEQAAAILGKFRTDLVPALNQSYNPATGTWGAMGAWIGKIFSVNPAIVVLSKRNKTYDEIQTYMEENKTIAGLRSMQSLAGVNLR